MGQKIHPTGFRLAVTRGWSSRWFANSKNFPGMLREDNEVRSYLKKKLSHASVSRVVIERPAKNARVTVFSARPGVVIGKKGEDIEVLRTELQRIMGVPVHVSIEEIRKPEIDAQLIADSITLQLEKRIMFRRAMKRAMQNAMRLGAKGIKIMSSGRLNGAEIARTEWYREGRVPLHTFRADIDYATSEAKTTYGIIGVKVWVYKGEMQDRNAQIEPQEGEERGSRKNLERGRVAKGAPVDGALSSGRPKQNNTAKAEDVAGKPKEVAATDKELSAKPKVAKKSESVVDKGAASEKNTADAEKKATTKKTTVRSKVKTEDKAETTVTEEAKKATPKKRTTEKAKTGEDKKVVADKSEKAESTKKEIIDSAEEAPKKATAKKTSSTATKQKPAGKGD